MSAEEHHDEAPAPRAEPAIEPSRPWTAEQALRAEASYRTLIERSPDGIAIHRDGKIVFVNAAVIEMLGYERAEELIGKPILDVVHPDDRLLVLERVARAARGEVLAPREEHFLRRDGSVACAEIVALTLMFEGAPAHAVLARDVSARKQVTARMMEMDRMIAVGTLAAGVGHEINNPLAYLTNNLQFAIGELRDVSAELASAEGSRAAIARRVDEVSTALAEALDGAERVGRIVGDLRALSRVDDRRRDAVDVHVALAKATNLAFNEVRHRARLVRDFSPTPLVAANESRLAQVFLNLLVNAAHAIPEGASGHHEIALRTWHHGGRVIVAVRDTGTGIAPEHLNRIFDPFFTTKPVGKGTGLGLAICRRIVHEYGGSIEVESPPAGLARGTEFRIALPATEELEPAPKSTTTVPAARASVLVVDDEPLVGVSIRRVLARDHDVVTLERAAEVLERLARGERFDVIFCDVMMPEMSGVDLYLEIERRFPDQAARVVFVTGGAFTPAAEEFLQTVSERCLRKPFGVRELRDVVARFVR